MPALLVLRASNMTSDLLAQFAIGLAGLMFEKCKVFSFSRRHSKRGRGFCHFGDATMEITIGVPFDAFSSSF